MSGKYGAPDPMGEAVGSSSSSAARCRNLKVLVLRADREALTKVLRQIVRLDDLPADRGSTSR